MSHYRQHTPVNTGKVQIGLAYIPPAQRLDDDAEFIQSVILSKQKFNYFEEIAVYALAAISATLALFPSIWIDFVSGLFK